MKNFIKFILYTVVIFMLSSCGNDDVVIYNDVRAISETNYEKLLMEKDTVILSFNEEKQEYYRFEEREIGGETRLVVAETLTNNDVGSTTLFMLMVALGIIGLIVGIIIKE